MEKVTHQGTRVIGQVEGRVGCVGWQEQLQHHTLANHTEWCVSDKRSDGESCRLIGLREITHRSDMVSGESDGLEGSLSQSFASCTSSDFHLPSGFNWLDGIDSVVSWLCWLEGG